MEYKEFISRLQKELGEKKQELGYDKMDFLEDGFTSSDEKELSIIRETNIKYYKTETDVLIGDYVILYQYKGKREQMCRFDCGQLYREHEKGGWEAVWEQITGDVYYDLPGGGQHDFETMEEALVREVLEETGYHVRVLRFVALAEEINDYMLQDPAMEAYREYAHRAIHIFLAELTGERREKPTEADFQQEESLWLPVREADGLMFFPVQINGRISELIRDEVPRYLGCRRWDSDVWS